MGYIMNSVNKLVLATIISGVATFIAADISQTTINNSSNDKDNQASLNNRTGIDGTSIGYVTGNRKSKLLILTRR